MRTMATLYPRLLAPSLRIGACLVQRPGRVPTAWSKLAARRPRTVQHDVVSIPNKVSFTTEAATQRATDDSNSSDASPAKLNFQSPKVEELFQRMSTLSKEEARMAFKLTLDALGIKFAPRDQQRRVANVAVEEPQEQEVKEEKSLFDLKLTGFDAKAKIKVIKEVRAIAGLGLKEAKELVEGAPKVIKKDIKPEQAEELKKKLEDVGATIEIS